MAYDEKLVGRVRTLLKGERKLKEQRMFGGLAMMLSGNFAVAVRGRGGLLVRVDPEDSKGLLSEPGTKLMKMRGKGLPGWISVDQDACSTAADLRRWVKRGASYAKTLPPKR